MAEGWTVDEGNRSDSSEGVDSMNERFAHFTIRKQTSYRWDIYFFIYLSALLDRVSKV